MKIYSFTFARSGSKGIKNKNLIKFNKKPLISWAIQDSIKSKLINKTFVSTDSLKIARVAKRAGAIVPFLRPKKLSTSISPEYLSWHHAINFLKSQEDINGNLDSIINFKYKIGDKVKINNGALQGSNAVFMGINDKQRVSVLLNILGRKLNISVPTLSLQSSWGEYE